MARYCASCGTEVDETALFCPTCGQPIDQETETAIPPAPAWPDPAEAPGREDPTRPLEMPAEQPVSGWSTPAEPESPPPSPVRPDPEPIRPVAERRYDPEPEAAAPTGDAPWGEPAAWERQSQPTRDEVDAAPSPPPMPPPTPTRPTSPAVPPAEPGGGTSATPLPNVPVTAPVTLSGWLIGGGATIAAIGALVSLFDGNRAVVDLLVLLAMAAVAISIFFASSLPALSNLRLATFALVLVAFGAATDRILAGIGGVGELLLFLGAAAAVIGALLLELGRDQPLGRS